MPTCAIVRSPIYRSPVTIREVPVLVSNDEPSALAADEPMILIGPALLSPHRLMIDFARGSVLIAQAE
jgi:hypothetical protein